MPSVSVLLTTVDRTDFLAIALRAIREQRYAERIELVLLADQVPAIDHGLLPPDTTVIVTGPISLGRKLDAGVRASTGEVLMKVDDDDWYGPDYVNRMVNGLGDTPLAFVQPFRFFDLDAWRILRADEHRCSGATLTFRRSVADRVPFRDVREQVDGWFLEDALAAGILGTAVDADTQFLQCRHQTTHSHVWNHMPDGRLVERYLADCRLEGSPTEILPSWANAAYRSLRG